MATSNNSKFSRRGILKGGMAAGLAASFADLGFLTGLPTVSAEEAAVDPKKVGLDPAIEPTVRLIEETPRDRLIEEVGSRLKAGKLNLELLGVCCRSSPG